MSCPLELSPHSSACLRRRTARRKRASAAVAAALPSFLALSCASPPSEPVDHDRRIEQVERELPDDPAIRAQLEAVEAARARERGEVPIEEVELRVGDTYLDEHRVRITARLPLTRPGEGRAQKDARRAETEMAVSRLEEIALERRAELCFPSVAALASTIGESIYYDYKMRQLTLLEWSEELSGAGMINELDSMRFEIDSRLKLATRAPVRAVPPEIVLPILPEIGAGNGELVREPEQLRELVYRHHPSVALRQATAERYTALANRARSRARPWVRFVDLSYERRTGEPGESSSDGVGGKVAFLFPVGGGFDAETNRYEALAREQRGQGDAIVAEQMFRSLQALEDLKAFEANTAQWQELELLADNADEVAERWHKGRLARPRDVGALLDEAYDARVAILEARERAGVAGCTLLAMTGVPLESWPRATAQAPESVSAR
jgi:hypothetical protein